MSTANAKNRILDQLREEFHSSPLATAVIAEKAGIDRSSLAHFVAGRTLGFGAVCRLARALDCDLVVQKP
ncbi:hypothetical protein ACFL2H_00420 [Planctomycetota bacterium]